MGYNNNRGKPNQHYAAPSPQMYSPYAVYQPTPYGFYGTPPMIPSQVAYYPPAALAGQPPYGSPQAGVSPLQFGPAAQVPAVDPTNVPSSPGIHKSPLPLRSTPIKVHTPIKLSDPVTHQPIELTRTSPASTTPKSAHESLASPGRTSSSEVSLSSGQSPKPTTPVVPSSSVASTPAIPDAAVSPIVGSPTPSKSSTASIDIRNQLKEQIRQRLEEEKKQKEKGEEEKRRKEQEEREKIEAAEREAREKVQREKREQEEKARLEKEKLEKENLEREQREKEEQEKIAKEAASSAAASAAVATTIPESAQNGSANKLSAATALAAVKSLEMATRPSVEAIEDLTYPSGISPPSAKSAKNRYRYDTSFLLQFQSVVTFPPRENWDIIRSIMSLEVPRQSGHSGKSFGGRSGSVRNASMGHNQPAMGTFGAGSGGFRQGDRSVSSTASPGFHMGGHGSKGLHRMSSATNLNSMSSKSGRQSSFRKKGGNNERSASRGEHGSGVSDHVEKQAVPVAPLVRSANAWVPRSKTAAVEAPPSENNRLPPDIVQRKVKSLLNKMTLENFARITDQILEVASQSKFEKDGRTLRQVIELTFAKACDEAHWSKMYAQFCAEMTTRVDPEIEDENVLDGKGNRVKGGPLFRKYLLSRCQEEFERGWSDKLPTNPDGSTLDVTDLESEEYYQAVTAKRRGLGLIRFIGELFILNLLSEKIIVSCIAKLVGTEDPSEEVIESLCQLVTTVGARLDSNPQMRGVTDFYFEKMQEIQNKPGLPSRLRFMLMDVADLRKSSWVDKNSDKGPKTLTQIHDEARAKQQAEEAARAASRNNRSNYRSDARPNNFATMAGDLTKLGRIRSQGPGQATLGPSSMLNRDLSGSNSSRKSASPALSLSKEGSRTPSQNQKVNIFEHLNDVEDGSDKKADDHHEEEKGGEGEVARAGDDRPAEESEARRLDRNDDGVK